MKRSLGILTLLIAGTLAYAPVPAHAQLDIPGADESASISISPRYPTPGDTVQLSLSSTLYDLDQSDITWRANGALITEGEGEKSASVLAGKLGERTTVTATITSDTGSALADVSFTPSTLDLLWESTSYTPPFYRGRSLSSAGASVILVALPHFGGSEPPSSSITYTWKKDGRVLSSLSGRGKSSAVIDGPTLYGSTVVTVDAVATDGSAAETTLRIDDQSAEIELYQDHPLYGILYNNAFGPTSFSSETESTFAAVPYFAPVSNANDRQLSYEWTVNRKKIDTDEKQPNEITINASNSSGIALISLELSDLANYFYSVNARWSVTLGTSNGRAQNLPSDPFSSH